MIKKNILKIAFICAMFILAVISLVAYMNLDSSQRESENVQLAYSKIILLSKIEKAILNGETGQRGFIITKNHSYLDPYFGSKNEINFLIEEYKQLDNNNTEAGKVFSNLESIITKKFEELNFTVNLKENNFDDSVAARINSNIGKKYMDSIRANIKVLLLKENEALRFAKENSLRSKKQTIWSYSIGMIISFGMILFVFINLQNENKLRKRLEVEANQSKLFFSTSLISIGDAVITTNAKGVITFMNKVAESITKWSSEEAEGRPIEVVFNIYKEGTREVIPSPVKIALETKKITGLKNHTVLLDRFNNEIYIDDSAAPILNEEHEVTGAVLIFRDISEKRKTEIKLEETYKEVNDLNKEMNTKISALQSLNSELESFTYSVSHDLRAPLRSINGFSKILQDEYGSSFDAEGKRLLKIVRDNAMKLGIFIDELLNFSKVGRKALNYKIVDFKKLVEDSIDLVENDIKSKDIFIINNLLPAYADEILMFEVWKNLINNAVKFSSKKETPLIEIGCEVNDKSIKYYVKDNGAGFNPAYSNKLFGVFQRLHSDSEFPGNGVGLALCAKIIKLHGGEITASSIPDEETIFSFTLPNRL